MIRSNRSSDAGSGGVDPPSHGSRMTVDQFLEWEPAEGPWIYELDEGRVVMSPSPFWWHGRVALYVAAQLDHYVGERGLGQVVQETDVVVHRKGRIVRRPDVCFVPSRWLDRIVEGYPEDAAELLVEITSEATRHVDLSRKREQYELQPSIQEYWVLDIVREPMEAYLWYREGDSFQGGKIEGSVLSSRLLKGFQLNLEAVWARALEGRS